LIELLRPLVMSAPQDCRMRTTKSHWRAKQYNFEDEIRRKKHLLASRQHHARSALIRRNAIIVTLAIGAVALMAINIMQKLDEVQYDGPGEAVRHLLASPNCDAARSVGLAPAGRGQPGYYNRHDADDDGIACEPYFGR
jgi:hypothetical protein